MQQLALALAALAASAVATSALPALAHDVSHAGRREAHVRHVHRVPKVRIYITEPRFAYGVVPQTDYVPRRGRYAMLPYVEDSQCTVTHRWFNGHFIKKISCGE